MLMVLEFLIFTPDRHRAAGFLQSAQTRSAKRSAPPVVLYRLGAWADILLGIVYPIPAFNPNAFPIATEFLLTFRYYGHER